MQLFLDGPDGRMGSKASTKQRTAVRTVGPTVEDATAPRRLCDLFIYAGSAFVDAEKGTAIYLGAGALGIATGAAEAEYGAARRGWA